MNDNDVANEIRRLGFDLQGNGDLVGPLSSIATVTSFPRGTLIFSEGAMHDRLYFVCEGTVSLEMATTDCGKKCILTAGRGDLLAWSGLLGDGRMTATAIAIEPTRAIEFEVEPLRLLCESNHEVGYAVMSRIAKALSSRLLATRLQLLDLFHVGGG